MHVKGRWNFKIVKCVKISGILQLIDRTIQTPNIHCQKMVHKYHIKVKFLYIL